MPLMTTTDATAPSATTDTLFTSLYEELRRLARRELWRNGARDLLGTHTVVHEAWLDLQRSGALNFDAQGRFLAYASRAMRGMVIDRLRARQADKRGGGFDITSLDTQSADEIAEPAALQDLSEALDELAALEPALAQLVDLKFFCGLTLAEVAQLQGISERTAQRQWEKARLLLFRSLETAPASGMPTALAHRCRPQQGGQAHVHRPSRTSRCT
jgi:RNA polymerase sigma factor (TIGR02999 family)